MSMGNVRGVTDIDIGVGRYGLRTFKPVIVRGLPHLVSVSQDAIPNVDPRFDIPVEWRELMTETHPVSWEDGTCKAVCVKYRSSRYARRPDGVRILVDDEDLHEPPDRKCGCGIYALDDLKELHTQYRNEARVVVAVISASGRTVECENGIRTAFARVVAYWVLDHEQSCRCELCVNKVDQGKRAHVFAPAAGVTPAWMDLDLPTKDKHKSWRHPYPDGDFPFLECAMAQFQNATRFERPEEMAEHYGLKASPMPIKVITGGSKAYVDMRDFLSRPAGVQGHFQFDIPIV